MKKLLIFTLVLILLSSFVCASNEGLEINEVTVYLNGEKGGTLRENSRFDEIVEPGDKLEFEIELENTFREEIDIEDIEIIIKIENIKEGENITKDISKFDLNDGNSKLKSIKIEIPDDADEIVKTVELSVRGIDENGTVHKIEWNFEINVNDVKHDISIYTTKIKPDVIECSGTVEVMVWMENSGSYDEEDVVLIVENDELGVYKKYPSIEIDEGEKYAKSALLELQNISQSDYYLLNLKTYYKDEYLDDIGEVGLTVHKCKEELIEIETPDLPNESTEEVVLSEVGDYNPQKINPNKSSSIFMGLLVGLLVLIIIIFIIVFALSRL